MYKGITNLTQATSERSEGTGWQVSSLSTSWIGGGATGRGMGGQSWLKFKFGVIASGELFS